MGVLAIQFRVRSICDYCPSFLQLPVYERSPWPSLRAIGRSPARGGPEAEEGMRDGCQSRGQRGEAGAWAPG